MVSKVLLHSPVMKSTIGTMFTRREFTRKIVIITITIYVTIKMFLYNNIKIKNIKKIKFFNDCLKI